MAKTAKTANGDNLTVEMVRANIGKGGPLAYLSEILKGAARVDFSLFVTVFLYLSAATDKADRKGRRDKVRAALALHGKESLVFTAENIGGLVVRFNLSEGDIFKRTRTLKENHRALAACKDKEEFLDKVRALETAAKADKADKADKGEGEGEGDKGEGDGKGDGKPRTISAGDVLEFLTVAYGAALAPVYKVHGSRPGDAGFKPAEFLAALVRFAGEGAALVTATATANGKATAGAARK